MPDSSDHALAGFLDSLPDEAVVLDNEGTIVYANNRWEAFADENEGDSSASCAGANYLDVTRAASRSDHEEAKDAGKALHGISRVLDGEQDHFEMEYPCHGPNNHRWFRLTATQMNCFDQVYTLVIHSSITALKEAEHRFRSGLTNLTCGIVVIGADAKVVMFNPAAERMFGYAEDEVLGQNVAMLMPQETAKQHDGYLHNYFDTGERKIIGIGRELMARRKDGAEFPIHLGIGEVETSSGTSFVGAITDLSELHVTQMRLKEALRDAEMANEAKSRFLAAMSHDLRTPLNSIRGFSEMLEHQVLGPVSNDRYREYHSIIRGSADHLVSMVEEILDLSRIESGEQTFDLTDLDPMDLSRSVIRSLQPLATEKNVVIELHSSDNMPKFITDDRKIATQLQTNLIANALHHSAGSSVDVHWKLSDDERIIFSVCDHGKGYPSTVLESFGSPFLVADPHQASEGPKGYGLGLYICKKLVEARGGTLTLSNGEDGGACAHAEWPYDVMKTEGS